MYGNRPAESGAGKDKISKANGYKVYAQRATISTEKLKNDTEYGKHK